MEYLPIVVPETLKEWKVTITSVGQWYESTEGQTNYKTSIGVTYGEQGQPMDIGKSNENFKDRKPKCFNCNKYGHMTKECWLKKKEWETRKYFKCNKEEYIVKNYRGKQSMQKRKIQEESEDKNNKEDKNQGFGENLE